MSNILEKYFQLKDHGTDFKTEVMAGLVTFMTMAYIIVVNPAILEAAGIIHCIHRIGQLRYSHFGNRRGAGARWRIK